MIKFAATLNVIAWGLFWCFGALALTNAPAQTGLIVTEALIAALAGGVGLLCYFRCVRHSEITGYAKAPNRVPGHVKMQEELA